MIILTGECGCGKSEIEKVLVSQHGYEKIASCKIKPYYYHYYTGIIKGTCRKKSVCILNPRQIKKLKKRLGDNEPDIRIFYIKVPRRDRLIKMFQRGDDIDLSIQRDYVDMELYKNIEAEADFVLNNENYFCDPENMAYWITECIRG